MSQFFQPGSKLLPALLLQRLLLHIYSFFPFFRQQNVFAGEQVPSSLSPAPTQIRVKRDIAATKTEHNAKPTGESNKVTKDKHKTAKYQQY